MGTYAGIFCSEGKGVPDNKKEEFAERVEKIFQAGGMMTVNKIRLCGKNLITIQKPQMDEFEMLASYNYFEDNFWERVTVGKEAGHVWSNKIGWAQFCKAVVAAYVLEELYTDGVAVATINGEPVVSWGYVGWINYLFDEMYHIKNYDPWKLFEAFHYSKKDGRDRIDWFDFGYEGYSLIAGCEILAVLRDSSSALEILGNKVKSKKDKQAFEAMEVAKCVLDKMAYKSELDSEEELKDLLNLIYSYCEGVNIVYKSTEEIQAEECTYEYFKDALLILLSIFDAPAFLVKALAETYHKDFWELWEGIRDVAKRKMPKLYGHEGYYVAPVSTQDFFRVSPDDMIPYWEEKGDFDFSKELWGWFQELRCKFDAVVVLDWEMEEPLKYILNLMEEANDTYYSIFTFTDFFEESVQHLNDKRYRALWKLYEEMIRDPELVEAGAVIFVPEGPEHEKEGLHYMGEQPKRRLARMWDLMEDSKRNNKARVTLRRYMALVANKVLRYKVFGF